MPHWWGRTYEVHEDAKMGYSVREARRVVVSGDQNRYQWSHLLHEELQGWQQKYFVIRNVAVEHCDPYSTSKRSNRQTVGSLGLELWRLVFLRKLSSRRSQIAKPWIGLKRSRLCSAWIQSLPYQASSRPAAPELQALVSVSPGARPLCCMQREAYLVGFRVRPQAAKYKNNKYNFV
jgi:hypothetical protein